MSKQNNWLFKFTFQRNQAASLSRIRYLRYKSRQSRQRFVMHLSSALQIASILAVLCHALQLALQITPILAVLCRAASLFVIIRPSLGRLFSLCSAYVYCQAAFQYVVCSIFYILFTEDLE